MFEAFIKTAYVNQVKQTLHINIFTVSYLVKLIKTP